MINMEYGKQTITQRINYLLEKYQQKKSNQYLVYDLEKNQYQEQP